MKTLPAKRITLHAGSIVATADAYNDGATASLFFNHAGYITANEYWQHHADRLRLASWLRTMRRKGFTARKLFSPILATD